MLDYESVIVTVAIQVVVIVQDTDTSPKSGIPVYVFDGSTYTGLTARPTSSARWASTCCRADLNGTRFWSGEANHSTIPGCLEALVEIPGRVGEVSVTIDYTYSPLYCLTDADNDTSEFFHYTYDALGNRLAQETHEGTNIYAYDIANRLIDVDGGAYARDANGNLLDDGVSIYTYDHANRLNSMTQGGDNNSFAYNGQGDRLQQTVGGVVSLLSNYY